MGHILTPEFLSAFKDQQDSPNPLIIKKLLHLHTPETYLLFRCNEQGMAYGYVIGTKFEESGSIPVFELEQESFPFVRRNKSCIMLPLIVDDSNFQPKPLDKAKYEHQKEAEIGFPRRKEILFELMYSGSPVLIAGG